MRSVAAELRHRTVQQVLALSAPDRVQLALALGDEDLDRFMGSSGLARDEALRRLRASRQRGRSPSVCARMDAA
jgi:hypothetical protein